MGIDAADVGRIHVQVGNQSGLRTPPGLAVHRGRLDEQDVRKEDGLRLVSLEHAVAEVLCRGPKGSSFVCADQVMARAIEAERPVLRAEIAHRIATRPDPPGRRRAETLISLATGRAESPGESLTLLALYDAAADTGPAGAAFARRRHPPDGTAPWSRNPAPWRPSLEPT